MGKGKRVREGRAAQKEAMMAAAAQKAKKDKIKKIGIIACSVVVVLALLAGTLSHVITSAVKSSGTAMRETSVVASENFNVDAAMMSYYFNYNYSSTVGSNQETYKSIGLDTSKSLKSQDCSLLEKGTWFDYFLDSALSNVKNDLYLAENAKKDGLSLDDEDKKNVQSIIDDYYEYASKNGIQKANVFAAMFGQGVKEGDVRNCLELSTLASKYALKWQDSLKYSDDELDKFYEENKDTYQYVDYLSYTIAASDTKNKETYADAKAKADELAEVGSVEAFEAWVEAEYRKNNAITEKFTKEDQDKGVVSALDKLPTTEATQGTIGITDLAKWFFEKANKGDTYIHDDKAGTYTVYYCTEAPYRDERITRNIRQIILTNETYGSEKKTEDQAIALLAEMNKKGLSEETFKTYAAEYSADTNTSGLGGLCENYLENYFVTDVGEWAFSEKRKEGDFEAVKYENGYALCYYVGKGLPAWKASCTNGMINEDYSEAQKEWEKDIKLTINDKGYSKISLLY